MDDKEVKVGDIVVQHKAIIEVDHVYSNGYSGHIILTKEAFVEAYNKWIRIS